MLTFLQFLAEQYLEEKLIMYNQGKRYGQIVFLAGGAGSGKGFAILPTAAASEFLKYLKSINSETIFRLILNFYFTIFGLKSR